MDSATSEGSGFRSRRRRRPGHPGKIRRQELRRFFQQVIFFPFKHPEPGQPFGRAPPSPDRLLATVLSKLLIVITRVLLAQLVPSPVICRGEIVVCARSRPRDPYLLGDGAQACSVVSILGGAAIKLSRLPELVDAASASLPTPARLLAEPLVLREVSSASQSPR